MMRGDRTSSEKTKLHMIIVNRFDAVTRSSTALELRPTMTMTTRKDACITYSDEKTSNNSRKRRDWRQNISRAFEGCRKQLLNRRIVVVGHHSLVSRSPAVAMALHSSFARSSRLINLRIKSKIFIEIYGMNAHTHTDGTLTENAHCLSDICYFICAW